MFTCMDEFDILKWSFRTNSRLMDRADDHGSNVVDYKLLLLVKSGTLLALVNYALRWFSFFKW